MPDPCPPPTTHRDATATERLADADPPPPRPLPDLPRATRGRAELARLLSLGVGAEAAQILARPPQRDDDERAYWRQLRAGVRRTPEACAAHARAQADRRRTSRAA